MLENRNELHLDGPLGYSAGFTSFFFFFAFVLDLLRPVIGLENSRHSLNQSDAELKPIKTWAVWLFLPGVLIGCLWYFPKRKSNSVFQNFQYNPWLIHLAAKLLVNDEQATSLIAHNPFSNGTPPL